MICFQLQTYKKISNKQYIKMENNYHSVEYSSRYL